MKSHFSLIHIQRYFSIILGAFLMSIPVNSLFKPNHVISGGVTGIALLLDYLVGVNVSLFVLIINIPLFTIGYLYVGKDFFKNSLIGMLSFSFFIQLTTFLPIISTDTITTIILGGAITGIGFGLIIKNNGSCGGSDIISKIINHHFSYSMASVNLSINLIVIAFAAFVFGIDNAIFTFAAMYVNSNVVSFVVEGIKYKRTVNIISTKHEALSTAITTELHRGVTVLRGYSGYTGQEKNVIYTIISISQLAKLKRIIQRIDPLAFVTISETTQVIGHGHGFDHFESQEKPL